MENASHELPADSKNWKAYRDWAFGVVMAMRHKSGERWITKEIAEELADDLCIALPRRYDPTIGNIYTYGFAVLWRLKVKAYRQHEREGRHCCHIDWYDGQNGYDMVQDRDSPINRPLSSDQWNNPWNKDDDKPQKIRVFELSEVETPEEIFEKSEYQDQISQAIMSLPERQRLVLELHYFEGYKIREIANLLVLPEGTIKSDLNLARKQLKKDLSEPVG